MKTKAITTILLTLFLLVTVLGLAQAGTQVELKYDDGTPEYACSLPIGCQYAVKFSLPTGWTNAKILTARYWLDPFPTQFKVVVYDSDGTSELESLIVTPTIPDWFDVPLNVAVDDDFYIVMEATGADLRLGMDITEPVHMRSNWRRGVLDSWKVDVEWDYLIRAVVEEPVQTATIDIDPNTLNLESEGQWITAYIELPEGYSVEDIDGSTVSLNDIIWVDLEAPTQIGDYDEDGIDDLMVKFDRAEVLEWLGTADYSEDTGKSVEVTLTVTGEVAGETFEGSDTVRVLLKG